MLAYQFYFMGEDGKDDLIAILPERRRNPERITDRSILNWATEVIGNGCHGQSIYFKVARYLQVENKIRAVVKYDLEAGVPLVQ